jgi:hypothetical protein
MVVLAKLQDGDFYPDLFGEGLVSGPVVTCSKCSCEYRVFYGSDETPASVVMEGADIPSLDKAVEQSHPQHGQNRIRVGTQD